MIREEIIENLWGLAVVRNLDIGKVDLTEIIDYVIKNYKPSLPSNLDEAAHSYSESDEPLYSPGHRFHWDNESLFGKQIETTFKAGAEWMARQGVSADSEVCKLADRAWVTPIDEKKFMQDVFDNFVAGDKVIVQIRKK